MKRKYFSPSNSVIIITVVCVLIICSLLYLFLVDTYPRYLYLSIAIFLILPIFKAPLYTDYSNKEIIVRYLIGGKKFNLEEYTISSVKPEDIGLSIRIFASGGFLGFFGWYNSKNLGKFYSLRMNTDDMLLLVNKKTGMKYIINNPFG